MVKIKLRAKGKIYFFWFLGWTVPLTCRWYRTQNLFPARQKKGKGLNSPPYCPLRPSMCFVSWTPHLFSRWSNQRVHYKGHVAVTQMAEWADCDLCTKSECITVSFWSQCQFQAGIFTHFPAHKPTHHRHTKNRSVLAYKTLILI